MSLRWPRALRGRAGPSPIRRSLWCAQKETLWELLAQRALLRSLRKRRWVRILFTTETSYEGVHFVDLDESFQAHIYLQNLASIQPRTSLVKPQPCNLSCTAGWLVAQCGAAAWIGRFVSSRKGSAKDRNTSVGGGHVMATPGTLRFSASGANCLPRLSHLKGP